MKVLLLGSVEAVGDGGLVSLGGVKPRAVLAALALERGRVVPAERLIDVVWGDHPPPTARAVIQTYVASLRRALAGWGTRCIVSDRRGYRLDVPEDVVDAQVFEGLVVRGRAAADRADHAAAAECFRTGLALWRGPALGGIGNGFLPSEAGRLDELRMTVTEECLDAELATGAGPQLVAGLTELVARHPTRERLRAGLMLALYRAGRQADALDVYARGRRVLNEELGIEPGRALAHVHGAILRRDPALLPATRYATPRQLPSPPPDFTGRRKEIVALRAALDRPTDMPIAVISGAGGMGKSTLAHRVGHELAARFPDGQLHIELHGSSPTPTAAEEVLGRVLRDFDTAATAPASTEERVARYRTLLAGTRTLVVLDDAATEAQVRPLLPGTPGCAVLVTSRNRLPAIAGATYTELGELPQDAAVDLLTHVVGTDRVAGEDQTAVEITRLCGRLPLAIRIAGARLVTRRHWPLARLASQLEDEQRRLDELQVGDQEVRASINLSYALLSERGRAALRRLGMLGLPTFSAWVAAAALDTGLRDAETVLDDLVDMSLVAVDGPDPLGLTRYRLHDLVRLFARERARAEEPAQARLAAVERVLGSWIWLVERINETVPPVVPSTRAVFRMVRPVDEDVAALVVARPYAWFRAEEEALIAGVDVASALGLDAVAVELASALSNTAFDGQLHVLDDPYAPWQRTHEAALQVARRNGNASGAATVLVGLGRLSYERDEYRRACDHLGQALAIFRAEQDVRGEATTLADLGGTYRDQGDLTAALHLLEQALTLSSNLAAPAALGHVRRLAGTVRLEMGDYPGAFTDLTAARELFVTGGSVRGEGLAVRSLSLYHRARAEWATAEDLARTALAIFEQTGDRLMVAYAERTLAKTLLRRDDPATAAELAHRALATCHSLNDSFGQACTLRVLGEITLATGRARQAREYLADSLRRWTELNSEVFRARTLHTLARANRTLGDTTAAREQTAEAIEIFRVRRAREFGELTGAHLARHQPTE